MQDMFEGAIGFNQPLNFTHPSLQYMYVP